ncbi:major capsid protein [Gordonia sp. (in: high G+C Gram-positive bacteria)]|uniref:major capsid protein n=1 Tax=Gordonia sp. (in: high G+C Gram-positive bacteria) TaxID=84139 RepID=UPI00333EBC22
MSLDLQAILDAAQNSTTDADRATAIKAAITDASPSRDDVNALVDEAVGKFNELNESGQSDGDTILGLELLTAVSLIGRDVQGELDAEADRVRQHREDLAAKVNGEETAPEENPDAPADGDATEATADDAAEVVAEAEAATAEAADAEPVVASAGAPSKRFHLSSIKPAPKAAPQGQGGTAGVAITAAADVRGFSTGQDLNGMDGLVAAAMARLQSMPSGLPNTHVSAGIAQLRTEFPDALIASGHGRSDEDAIEFAASEGRLTGGSLLASGGWCAPSETMYELAPLLADPNAGILSMPEIQVPRGGIRTAGGVDFSAVWAGNAGMVQTEAQAEAGTEKVLYRPVCPTFTEKRADVIYSGVEVGFLQNDAYPEVTKQTLEGVLAVHAHRINASSIARMVGLSGTEIDLTGTIGPSATGSTLNGLGLIGTDYRYRFRAPESMTLEVVAPAWLKEVIRADLSLRAGDGQYVQVTDAQIDGYFTARGVKVSWVYDWQDAFTTNPATGFGGATPVTEYPETANVLVYAAGTFVRGRGEVVNLDTVYDSTNIKKNDYLAMFAEEKLLVHKRAHQALNVKLPLGVNGTTGIGQILDANGKIAPVTP